MAHLLTPTPTTAAASLSTRARKSPPPPFLGKIVTFQLQEFAALATNINNLSHFPSLILIKSLLIVMTTLFVAVILGLSLSDEENVSVAARAPASPPKEKKDPNVSGVQAKVLASKRRKEAMKEEVAKLRERGKPVNKEPPPPPPPPSPVAAAAAPESE